MKQDYINVERSKLKREVIEMLDTEETADVIVHNTPIIDLSDEVIPCQTQVTVKGSGINLTLSKKLRDLWSKLSCATYSWIKIDFDSVHDEAAGNKSCKDTEQEKSNDLYPPKAQCEFNVELDSDDVFASADVKKKKKKGKKLSEKGKKKKKGFFSKVFGSK